MQQRGSKGSVLSIPAVVSQYQVMEGHDNECHYSAGDFSPEGLVQNVVLWRGGSRLYRT